MKNDIFAINPKSAFVDRCNFNLNRSKKIECNIYNTLNLLYLAYRLSEILEVRKGKHGIVEVTAVKMSENSGGKSEEIDSVARHGKLDPPYEVIMNSKTKEKKFLQEPEINR
jgi:hypothetical protein